MLLKKIKFWYVFFALIAFVLAFYTVVFHIKFTFLPVLFVILGFVSYLTLKEKALYLFVFLLPVVNSLPDFYHTGYSFNFMALTIFYLSGIIVAALIRGEKLNFYSFNWSRVYIWFLAVLWISAFFVFLKWSNFSMGFEAFLADTPVAPGSPDVIRTSFAIIYPVATLFLFSIPPFIAVLIKENQLKFEKIYQLLVAGFSLSFVLALYQKYFDADFMALEWWGSKLNQYNGGSSDFNGFGFFAGVLFLISFLQFIKVLNSGQKFTDLRAPQNLLTIYAVIMTFSAIMISGCRTAFIFIIAAVLFLFLNRKLLPKTKLIFLTLIIIFLLITGSVLKSRLKSSVNQFVSSFTANDFLSSLDKASNGRIRMIIDSLPTLKKYPLSGIGTGNFLFHLRYLRFGEKYWEDLPLNQYLLIQNETGLIGLTLFLLFFYLILYGKIRDNLFRLITVIFFALLVNNFFWFPEIIILFWIMISFLKLDADKKKELFRGSTPVFWSLVLLFIISNIFSLSSLQPRRLLAEKGFSYNYGFWSESIPSNFKWTKSKAGIYLRLNEVGESKNIKIFCGAPVHNLKDGVQQIKLIWKGHLFKIVEFRENRPFSFKVTGEPGSEGFLKLEVNPTFNLNKMGLGQESRTLGVQVFFDIN